MKKKLFVLLLAIAVSTSMIACGADKQPPADSDSNTKVEDSIGTEDDETSGDDEDQDTGSDEDTGSAGDSANKPADKPASKPGGGSAANKPNSGSSANKPGSGSSAALKGSLSDIVAGLYKSAKLTDLNTASTEITADNMAYYLGVNNLKIKQGLGFEPMMSSIAHSVVLIELESGQDISKVKADIKNNVDGYKWICVGVEPENILVDNIGNFVLLVMDENAKSIMDAFKALA